MDAIGRNPRGVADLVDGRAARRAGGVGDRHAQIAGQASLARAADACRLLADDVDAYAATHLDDTIREPANAAGVANRLLAAGGGACSKPPAGGGPVDGRRR